MTNDDAETLATRLDQAAISARAKHSRNAKQFGVGGGYLTRTARLNQEAAALIRRLRDERDEAIALTHRQAESLRVMVYEDSVVRNKALDEAASRCEFMLWEPDGVTPDPQFLRGYSEATNDCMNAILALKEPKP
jgi:Trk K+ transport system NAD-binding subunit